ncbi:MAG: hypothetical protein IRZ08_17270 [Frankia sp.]|nr:hypothetical protein [Frankia sp.]
MVDQAVGERRAVAAGVADRTGRLLDVVLHARGGDPELEAFAATIDQERLLGATAAVRHWSSRGLLRDDLSVEAARDVVWMLISPAVDSMLRQRGWSRADYQDWLARTLLATILRDEPTAPESDGS